MERLVKGKVSYQIYPKAFKDSNGDIVRFERNFNEKLDYLQDLGLTFSGYPLIIKSLYQGQDINHYVILDPLFWDYGRYGRVDCGKAKK